MMNETVKKTRSLREEALDILNSLSYKVANLDERVETLETSRFTSKDLAIIMGVLRASPSPEDALVRLRMYSPFSRAVEFFSSQKGGEWEYFKALEGLQKALESTLECFDDLVERLNCFCTIQDKAEMLYEASSNLDLRNDPRKQIALYIKTAVLNVYSENLKRKNLEALIEAVSVANQPEPSDSDRRKVLHILYSGGLHAFPHLKGNLSEATTERKD